MKKNRQMIAGPLVMNIIQLWVQDQFLKNAPPETGEDSLAGGIQQPLLFPQPEDEEGGV